MVQDNVSNATIGKMRMQFWRDAVKEITEVRADHFVACSKGQLPPPGQTTQAPNCASSLWDISKFEIICIPFKEDHWCSGRLLFTKGVQHTMSNFVIGRRVTNFNIPHSGFIDSACWSNIKHRPLSSPFIVVATFFDTIACSVPHWHSTNIHHIIASPSLPRNTRKNGYSCRNYCQTWC